MDSLSPIYLLLAAVVCSFVGRALLVRAAWEISKGWGLAVIFVPLAPMFFLMNYKELRGEGKNWRTASVILFLAFMGITGSTGSFSDLWEIVPNSLRPAKYAEHQDSSPEEAAAEAAVESPEDGSAPAKPAATPAVVAAAAPVIPVATPPPGPTLAQRLAANQAEFKRLAEVYEGLKKERGYLKKWDQEAINSYNDEAKKYQTALAAARAEQVELNKQIVLVKK